MTEYEELRRPGFTLDPALVMRFVSGELDERGEAELADQVARVIAFHAELPTGIVARMAKIVKHLGGDEALMRWLEQFPGRPRILTRIFGVIELLDAFTADSGVVRALAELRADHADPPGLGFYMSPDTDHETLGTLAWHIESLLANDRVDEAVRVALDAATLVERLAPRARELNPLLPQLGALAGQARAAVAEAALTAHSIGDG